MDLVSIIVPVYNVQEYVSQCIESICNQTYGHIEIILVDDGSTDQSGAICDKYASMDDRIIVVHQENKGLSTTRNVGLNHCTGQYLVFVDSDDWISPVLVEKCIDILKKEGADCVQFNYAKVIGAQQKVDDQFKGKPKDFSLIQDKFSLQITQMFCSMYRSSVFENIRFPDGILCEDLYIMPEILLHISRMTYISEALYYYRHRETSITGTLRYGTVKYDVAYGIKRIEYLPRLDAHYQTTWFSTAGLRSIYSGLLVAYIRDIKHNCLDAELRKAVEKYMQLMKFGDYSGYNSKQRNFAVRLFRLCPSLMRAAVKLRIIN